MAADKSNPAGRLYRFFSAAKGRHGGITRTVLGTLLGVADHDDVGRITERLALLRQAADEAEQELSRVEGTSEVYLRPYPKIREAVTYWLRAIDKSWDTTTHYLREINLDLLEVGADTLSRVGLEKAVEKTKLDSFLEEIERLRVDIMGSDVTPELKNILVGHLQNIREAIELYDLSGMAGIRKAQEAAIGAVITNCGLFEAAESESVVRRFVEFLGDITTIYGALEIVQRVVNLLGP